MNIFFSPLYLYFLFFSTTLFLYLFGPVDYVKVNTPGLVIILFTYKLFLLARYIFAVQKFKFRPDEIDLSESRESNILFKIIFIYSYLVLNLAIYTGFDFSAIFEFSEILINALVNPLEVYQDSLDRSQLGGIYILILVLLSPLFYLILSNLLLSFGRLGILYKVLIIIALLLEFYKWTVMGRNKGVFEIVILVSVVAYSLGKFKLIRGSQKATSRKFLFTIMILVLVVGALAYFDNALTARKYAYEDYNRFDHLWLMQLVPDFLKSLVVNITVYLAEGYRSLSLIMYENWTPMWGIGHSTILTENFSNILSHDFYSYSYQMKLSRYGIDPFVNWHSAYVWFANDFHWLGVSVVMFMIGYLFASSWMKFLKSGSNSEFVIFFFVVLSLVFLSGNTQVFNQTVSTVSFWSILAYSRVVKRLKF